MSVSFKDTEGREWSVRIDVATIRRVREAVGIDLGNVYKDKESLSRLQNDVVLFCDVLFLICQPQAELRKVDAEAFGTALAGEAIGSACIAFQDALVEFLPPERRRLMRQLVDGQRASQAQAELRIQNAINKGMITNLIQEEMAALDRILLPTSGTSS